MRKDLPEATKAKVKRLLLHLRQDRPAGKGHPDEDLQAVGLQAVDQRPADPDPPARAVQRAQQDRGRRRRWPAPTSRPSWPRSTRKLAELSKQLVSAGRDAPRRRPCTACAGAGPALPHAPRTSLLALAGLGRAAGLAGRLLARRRHAAAGPAARLRQHGRSTRPASFRPTSPSGASTCAEMVVTLQIALWGTALAVVCAVPLALLSSANITPWWVHQPVRRLMDACRAINEMVFAMLFIVAVGLGPVRRRAGAVDPHHRRPGQAVLRSGGGHRPAAGRRHPRHRRQRAGTRSSTA